MRIYVAGPLTTGHTPTNIRRAVEVADRLVELGHAPYVPHLTYFWHLISPHKYDWWLKLDKKWLAACDAILRLPGESPGAEKEIRWAKEFGLCILDISFLDK